MRRLLIVTTPGVETLAAKLLADIAHAAGERPIAPELFTRDTPLLNRTLGANTPERARLIAHPADDVETEYAIAQALEETGAWGTTDAYNPNRLELFERCGLDVIALFCAPRDSQLGPAAVEGLTRAYYSGREAGEITGPLEHGSSVVNAAWLWYWRHILPSRCPVVHAATLRHGSRLELCDELAAAFPLSASVIAERVLEARRASQLAPR